MKSKFFQQYHYCKLFSRSCCQCRLSQVDKIVKIWYLSGSCQAIVRQLSYSCQKVVRYLSVSHQAVIRQAGSGWKNESMVSGDPGKKLFGKQGTNRNIASGDRRGHSPITIIFQGWKGDNPFVRFFRGGEGEGTFNGFILSSLNKFERKKSEINGNFVWLKSYRQLPLQWICNIGKLDLDQRCS